MENDDTHKRTIQGFHCGHQKGEGIEKLNMRKSNRESAG